MLIYLQIIAGIWIVFMAFLFIPALWASTPVERRSIRYIEWSIILAIIIVTIIVLLGSYESKILILRVYPDSQLAGITGIILAIIGLGGGLFLCEWDMNGCRSTLYIASS